MAYDKDKIFEQAVNAIKENDLYFIEDIVAYIPISKPTFYDYFKVDSNEINDLKRLLNNNRISAKVKMRKNWKDSDNATLQMGLYKLIGSDDERKKLNSSYIDQKTEHSGELKITRIIKT